MPRVAPTARVSPEAVLSPGCVVGERAVVGPGCVLHAYAIVGPDTELGHGCQIHPFAVIGGDAQDRRTPPGAGRLICGAENIFREHVTVSRGSSHGGGVTRLGSGNLLMAGAHVGHDCQLGDGITLANNVSLAGHVSIGDRVGLGGHAAVHQFARIGELAFIAANAMVSQDVPPYCLAAGDHARLYGLNITGLRRAGFDADLRRTLARVFKALYAGRRPPDAPHAPELTDLPDLTEVRQMVEFRTGSMRGITPSVRPSIGHRVAVDSPGAG